MAAMDGGDGSWITLFTQFQEEKVAGGESGILLP